MGSARPAPIGLVGRRGRWCGRHRALARGRPRPAEPRERAHRPVRFGPADRALRRRRPARPPRRAARPRPAGPRRDPLLRPHRHLARSVGLDRPSGSPRARHGALAAAGAGRRAAAAGPALDRDHRGRSPTGAVADPPRGRRVDREGGPAAADGVPRRRQRPVRGAGPLDPPDQRAPAGGAAPGARDDGPRLRAARTAGGGPRPPDGADGADGGDGGEPDAIDERPIPSVSDIVDLPTEAGMPVFDDEDEEVAWLRARSTPPPPPPPFEEPPNARSSHPSRRPAPPRDGPGPTYPRRRPPAIVHSQPPASGRGTPAQGPRRTTTRPPSATPSPAAAGCDWRW